MLKHLACIVFGCISQLVFTGNLVAQNQPWVRYTDPATGNCGFRTTDGTIMTPAIYEPEVPDTFYHIAAVTEHTESESNCCSFYFLRKDGKKLRVDNNYAWKFYPHDCECEGKILYRDKTTGKTGFLDTAGNIVIPAVYTYATPFFNGVSFAFPGNAPDYGHDENNAPSNPGNFA